MKINIEAKKMPIAIPILILLGTADINKLDARSNNEYKLIIDCIFNKHKPYAGEIIKAMRAPTFEITDDSSKYDAILKNKDKFNWFGLISYFNWLDEKIDISVPSSTKDLKSIFCTMIETHIYISSIKYDDNYIVKFVELFIKPDIHVISQADLCDLEEFIQNKYKTYEQYINLIIKNMTHLKKVYISTYAGSTWLRSSDIRLTLIKKLSTMNIPIIFLINNSDNYNLLLKLMRDKNDYENGFYAEYDELIKKWLITIKRYNNVQVKICNRPIVNSFILPVMDNKSYSFPACIGIYQYHDHDNAIYIFKDTTDKYIKEYEDEFVFLLKNESVDITNNDY